MSMAQYMQDLMVQEGNMCLAGQLQGTWLHHVACNSQSATTAAR